VVERVLKGLLFITRLRSSLSKMALKPQGRGDDFLAVAEAMRRCLTRKCPFANLPSSRTSHFGEGITTEEMKELCWLKARGENQFY